MLLILVVEKGKLGNNAYLTNPFKVAQSFESKPIIQNDIKTIEIVGSNGVVQKEYYNPAILIRTKKMVYNAY